MAALGPFEDAPVLAVAVSGGADSLALAVLAGAWTAGRGGRVVGLSVDHGLRAAAAGECRQVGTWLAGLGMAHHTLTYHGAPPTRGIQAAARDARYRLLTDWCRANGVPHLLLAHHRDDQVETFLMRLARGSGLDGLAGMPALSRFAGVRILRPLLGLPKARLVGLLENRGQDWIEDPSNRDPAFRRSRLRRRLARLTAAELAGLAATARAFAGHRQAVSAMASDLAAAAVDLHPAGYAELSPARYAAAPAAIRRRLLARLLMCVGGGGYPPRADRLSALDGWLAGPAATAGRTLAGCRLLPRPGRVLICREAGRLTETRSVVPGERLRWDRFRLRIADGERLADGDGLRVRRLGTAAWRQLDETGISALPGAVRPGLPTLWRGDRLLSGPHFAFQPRKSASQPLLSAVFAPAQALVPDGFTLA